MVQFASYLRRVLAKTRLIFSRINGPIVFVVSVFGGIRLLIVVVLMPFFGYLKYIDLAKPKSGAPGLFIRTGYRISENKRLWNCPPLGFPGNCLIMSFSSLPN